jgi:cell wall-associated NlpC family hydrolase
MVNRIILSAVITLALAFSPSIAFSVPTKGVKKKSSKQGKVCKPSKTAKKSKVSRSRTRSRSASRRSVDVAESSMVPSYRSSGSSGVSETPPLMKVVPQRDGKFLLEPLSPKKTVNTPLSKPGKEASYDRTSSAARSSSSSYNHFEPWNFSDLILTQARYYRDTPYARGGSLEYGSATDCSGFVQYIYHGFKINLPRSSAEQAQVGKVVSRSMDFGKLLPGDLLFFNRGGRHVGHAGIYLGEGKMIHASNHRNGVTVTDLRQPYYEGTFVVAKRVFEVKYSE